MPAWWIRTKLRRRFRRGNSLRNWNRRHGQTTLLTGLEGYSSTLSNGVIDVNSIRLRVVPVVLWVLEVVPRRRSLSIGSNLVHFANSNVLIKVGGSSSNYNEIFEWTPSSTGCARFATETMSTDNVLSPIWDAHQQEATKLAQNYDGGIAQRQLLNMMSTGSTYYLQPKDTVLFKQRHRNCGVGHLEYMWFWGLGYRLVAITHTTPHSQNIKLCTRPVWSLMEFEH